MAAGVQVSPARLEINLANGQTAAPLTVSSPSGGRQDFVINAEGFAEFILIEPKKFPLLPGEKRTAKITA